MAEAPECPVCFNEAFVSPVSLSCGHILCWTCLHETRESGAQTANLCPHSLCEYDRATPIFLSGIWKHLFDIQLWVILQRISGHVTPANGAERSQQNSGVPSYSKPTRDSSTQPTSTRATSTQPWHSCYEPKAFREESNSQHKICCWLWLAIFSLFWANIVNPEYSFYLDRIFMESRIIFFHPFEFPFIIYLCI